MKTKKDYITLLIAFVAGFIGFILWGMNTFQAKSVLWSLWQYYDNYSSWEDVIYVTGVKVWIWTNTPKTTLDINWAIKIGDTTVNCDSSLIWAIRYHEWLFQVCNWTSWN